MRGERTGGKLAQGGRADRVLQQWVSVAKGGAVRGDAQALCGERAERPVDAAGSEIGV